VFTKVLVANRGEIAVRVIRTLRSLGIASVAVFSEPDRDAVHVALADEAVLLGPAEARLSYLDIEKVVAAAVRTGAQAVHPGYGFLSENADFAEACERAGIVFVGPDSRSIRLMGDKRGAKDSVAALGVPVVPGFHGAGADDRQLEDESAAIGFPVIVKPSAGGGGKGMRVVRDRAEVAVSLASARREARSAFGDDTLLLEKYVPRARHVEVQVLGDGRGDVVHLGDRDCSLQRRHQKVVEEAPAPALPDDVRARMHADAVAIARSVDYRGVGTVEFVVDADDPATYYFLEMNTRLQVEHPVTEMVTGLDLVELQLRVAAGGGLPFAQDDVRITGHAVEARVYAEDGHHGFLPSSGPLVAYLPPDGARVDSGVREGGVVSTSYDPLLLKVIAHGTDRDAALDSLDAALARTVVLGLAHNVGVLRDLLADDHVRAAAMTTSLIGDLGLGSAAPSPDVHRTIAAALLLASRRERREPVSPWTGTVGWRVVDRAPVRATLVDEDGTEVVVSVLGSTDACTVAVGDDEPVAASLRHDPSGPFVHVVVDGVARRYAAAVDASGRELVAWIGLDGDAWSFRVPVRHRIRRPDDADEEGGELRSPMPGAVVVLAKREGDAVGEGEVIAVVEAMKMEYPLVSPFAGRVASVAVTVGAQVVRDQVVATVHPEEQA
jgi:acetyl-CoA/propionyl-CoA carboxylase biotin carboxyl carrier protein